MCPKSKHRKNHREKLDKYKSNKKIEQESLKKKMIDQYIKMQQENLANKESHTSTEEVVGPEINLDELNMVEEFVVDPPISLDNVVNADLVTNIETIETTETNDNNNQ